MTPFKRPLLATGAALGLACTLTACGGSAPTDASTEEFCGIFVDELTSTASVDEDDFDAQADEIHNIAEKLNDVGTPKGISDEAREGFEIYVDAAKDVSADDLEKAADSGDEFDAGISGDDQDKAETFYTYATEICAEQIAGDVPSDQASDLASE